MFHKVLVAIDDSEISQHIFDEAIFLAKSVSANVLLLHVLSPFESSQLNPVFLQPNGVYPALHTEAVNRYMMQWENLKQERHNLLSSLAEKGKQAGIDVEFSQNFGDPGRMICDVARSWNADLIIVGRRGRRGLSELFLGSVSNYVLHNAPCSVLTVQGLIHEAAEASEATIAVSA
ncbi:MAG: universal stress protein [Scytonema sp. PMC 1070.18]|nr:universal stress protein [Scytonema sp. PMC 1070.18]